MQMCYMQIIVVLEILNFFKTIIEQREIEKMYFDCNRSYWAVNI